MKPIFIRTPAWFENPVPLDQKCENITMMIPSLFLFGDQTYPIADSYWMSGGAVMLNVLPNKWIGLCAQRII